MANYLTDSRRRESVELPWEKKLAWDEAPPRIPRVPWIPSRTFASTPRDDDAAVRTILGEAEAEGYRGQLAVGNVIANRAEARKQSPYDVVHAPSQFSPWTERSELMRTVKPSDLRYQSAKQAWEAVKAGQNNVGKSQDYWAHGVIGTPDYHKGKPTFDIGGHRL